jgi:carboxymethylenebutenolidase
MKIPSIRNVFFGLILTSATLPFLTPLTIAQGMAPMAGMPMDMAPQDMTHQEWARQKLEASPRHQEWVKIPEGKRTLVAFVVYPEVKEKAPVVVLIHEIFGLSDWARSMADDLAAAGFIVVAPDLLSGYGPGGGGSDTFPNQDATTKAVSMLDADGVNADLNAAADYGKKLPASNGKLAVVGFCWGGGKSFEFATKRADLSAAFVFYGSAPTDISGITAPVYGFYGGNDARISATVPDTKAAMAAAGKKYAPIIYAGAGHGFMRTGEEPGNTNPDNVAARKLGMWRLVTLLKGIMAGDIIEGNDVHRL